MTPADEPGRSYRPETLAVRGGLSRTGFDETSEAMFLTSGFVYSQITAAFVESGLLDALAAAPLTDEEAAATARLTEEAVTTLLGLGFHRVLTSGGAARARDGAAELAAMVRAGEGLLDVCAGGGVRPVDIPDLARATGLSDVHLSARRRPGAPVEPDAPSTDTDPAIAAAAVDAAGAL